MKANELLAHLEMLGADLSVCQGKLRVGAARGLLSEELKSEIGAQKAELLTLLAGRSRGQAAFHNTASIESETEQEFSLSFAQRRIWFLEQLQPGNSAYNLNASFVIDDALDVAALENAINDVLQRQTALRTVFREINGEPIQVVRPFQAIRLCRIDLSHLSQDELSKEVQRVAEVEAVVPFDLVAGPLFRAKLLVLGPRKHLLLFSIHHIVSDNWSLGIFQEELTKYYQVYRAGGKPDRIQLPIQYGEYAMRENARLAGRELDQILDYWYTRLAGAPPILDLPTDKPRPPQQTFNGAVLGFRLPLDLSDALRRLARRERATLYMVLLATFKALLYRYSGQTDIVVGTAVANRPVSQLEKLIGLFVNTLPIRSDLGGDPTIQSLISQVRETVLDAQAHRDLPFEKLVEKLRPERNMAWSPVFQVTFVLQNTPLSSSFYNFSSGTAMFDLTLFVWDDPAGIAGSFEYNTDLFEPDTIERMSKHFLALAKGIIANPEHRLSELPLLEEDERQQLLFEWNRTQANYALDRCLHELFETQVERVGGAIAVIFEDEALTYQELNRRANQLGRHLRSLGVGPESLVAICVERSLEMVVGLLGILKAGGAYLPLDPSYPRERLSFMLDDARPRVLLTQGHLFKELPTHGTQVVYLDVDWERIARERAENLTGWAEAENLAYVIYTSGSTGLPKGTLVTHRAICNHLQWRQQAYPLASHDRFLQKASLSFDISVWEIFAPLLAGARLVLAKPGGQAESAYLLQLVAEQEVTVIHFIPGMLHMFLEETKGRACDHLRRVFCGGEPLSAELKRLFLSRLKNATLHHQYGPTETTVDVIVHDCDTTDDNVSAPIGRPIANTQAFILDTYRQPVPIGVPGELYIGGASLARGYLNRPELTAQRFVPNPFANTQGERLYRTGDCVRYRGDGTIEFIGRIDQQVKVRGFRIELGEIEAVLAEHAAVRQVVVVTRGDVHGEKQLVAYITLNTGQQPPGYSELREHLRTKLPDYMVPTNFVMMEALPLTPNGKIDRAALPEPTRTQLPPSSGPRTLLETQLYAIWEQELGHSGFGMHDNFFDLGGHSMLAVRVFARIERIIGHRLPISTLFQAPTLAELAKRLEHAGFNSPWSSLVTIQPDGPNPPLFLVPGIGGNVVCYSQLAKLLGTEQPLYGLQSRGLDGHEKPFETIEPMAAHYISEIRKIQPTGPYYLGGTCVGGVIAYEMAQQLRAAGEKVAFLVLLETWPPLNITIINRLLHSHHARFLFFTLKRHILELMRLPKRRLATALMERLRIVREIIEQRDIYRGDKVVMYVDNVSLANSRALSRYRPRPYDGELSLVFASARTFSGKDRRQLWRELARRVHSQLEIPVDYAGVLLVSPHVEVLAEWMRKLLHKVRQASEVLTLFLFGMLCPASIGIGVFLDLS